MSCAVVSTEYGGRLFNTPFASGESSPHFCRWGKLGDRDSRWCTGVGFVGRIHLYAGPGVETLKKRGVCMGGLEWITTVNTGLGEAERLSCREGSSEPYSVRCVGNGVVVLGSENDFSAKTRRELL